MTFKFVFEVDSVDVLELFTSFPSLVTDSCVVTVVEPFVFFDALPTVLKIKNLNYLNWIELQQLHKMYLAAALFDCLPDFGLTDKDQENDDTL